MTQTARAYHHGDLPAALVDEAARMIAEGGVDSVTMRALGERLGVSRAAAYRHFADKEALLIRVAAVGFSGLWQRLQDVDAGEPQSSVERARKMGEEYVRFALENPAHYRLMYSREGVAREDQPELREAANAIFEHLVGIMEGYQEAGVFKKHDPRTQAYVAWGAMHGVASLLIDGQIMAAIDVDRLIRQTTLTLLEGMQEPR